MNKQQEEKETLASKQLLYLNQQPSFLACYPESDSIEPERAKFLYEQHCAILILKGLPLASEFGLDLFAHRVGEKFQGVKLIPPGVHFVYASAIENKKHVSSNFNSLANLNCGPRCGFIYNFKPREIVIKKWSTLEEDFDDSYQASEEEYERYRANLRDLDPYLGPYKYSSYRAYLALITKLTPDIVQDLTPDCNRLRSVPFYLPQDVPSKNNDDQAVPSASTPTRKGARLLNEETLLPHLKPDDSTVIHFTKIPTNHTDSKSPIAHDMITHYNLDTTLKLEHTFSGQIGRDRLLSELQFAFITFILYHIYDCFEHWKRLLALVCLADSGLTNFPKFFQEFLQILDSQMDHVPEDLFDDIVDANNLVRWQLDNLFRNISDCSSTDDSYNEEMNTLKKLASNLRERLENKFGWQFELEREDEQPVIVDI